MLKTKDWSDIPGHRLEDTPVPAKPLPFYPDSKIVHLHPYPYQIGVDSAKDILSKDSGKDR